MLTEKYLRVKLKQLTSFINHYYRIEKTEEEAEFLEQRLYTTKGLYELYSPIFGDRYTINDYFNALVALNCSLQSTEKKVRWLLYKNHNATPKPLDYDAFYHPDHTLILS